MAIEYIKQDLIKAILNENRDNDIHIVIQNCNCMSTMNAGIALEFKKNFKEVYEVDANYNKSPEKRLGKFTKTNLFSIESDIIVYNAYGQLGYGGKDPKNCLNIIELKNSLNCIADDIYNNLISSGKYDSEEEITIALPKIGSGNAKGNWKDIEQVLEVTLGLYNILVYTLD